MIRVACHATVGTVIHCRVYRGPVTSQQDTGIYFTSHGGGTDIQDVQVHAMGSIWMKASDQPAKAFEPAERKSA